MSDGGSHFKAQEVTDYCNSWGTETKIVAAYSPWVNGLVEGTNKLLLHILARQCAPALGEDELETMSWEKLPMQWPLHLDDAVRALNGHILPALVHSPKELLLGTVINTKRTGVEQGAESGITAAEAEAHLNYVTQ